MADDDRAFEALLEYLRRARGFDFTGYKRASLNRRITKQMQTRGISTFEEYFDYLQVHPDEFEILFNSILINVTGFFRDPQAWAYLQHQILSPILQDLSPDRTFRVWSAGCASGQEAYTIAMILGQELGEERLREQVKIYATDVDEEALCEARHAIYSQRDVEEVPDELLERYFEPLQGGFVFRSELRRSVIFGRHDLVQDAPISRLDLLVCRNTLMYFNSDTQSHILNRFHFALNPTGILFLGKAEMLLTHTDLFTPIHLQYRVFRCADQLIQRARMFSFLQEREPTGSRQVSELLRLYEQLFDSLPLAELVIGPQGTLVLVNHLARTLFGLSDRDLGRPLQDLEVSYQPLELRSRIQQALATRDPLLVRDVRVTLGSSITYWDVQIKMLQGGNEAANLGISITFADVTRNHDLQVELQRSNQELETANEELQSSNEELETTNEELQSTNEELETTNEELQSTKPTPLFSCFRSTHPTPFPLILYFADRS